jgi:hypothetical protein
MKNNIALAFALIVAATITILACTKDTAAVASTDFSFSEGFDTVSKAVDRGWVIANNTKPIGTMAWVQGFFYVSLYPGKLGISAYNYVNTGGFAGNNPSYAGADFIMTTADCGSGNKATCSNWLISPEVMMKDGDQLSFYTRTYKNPAASADRLEVRVNTANGTANVGTDSNSIGGFAKVILDLNPKYLLDGAGSYPGEWTKYSATIAGVPVAKKSRIAFRYYVPNGGPLGANSVGVGIDQFSFISK